ncbi:hypothetical protein OCU04_013037 [Sclerotinia nivalis]|uniref:Uncharacterized protein n=1 Tax=Sclerotinia nivalis TaxID=352851 RepID=A0A9X0A7Z9_9HELO|nr:hypothetical protein OCU04_013037 [Sclerotinia nivalis]
MFNSREAAIKYPQPKEVDDLTAQLDGINIENTSGEHQDKIFEIMEKTSEKIRESRKRKYEECTAYGEVCQRSADEKIVRFK